MTTLMSICNMETVFAFGKPVPESVIAELKEEYPDEQITTDFVETLYEYEYRDNR